MRAVFYTSMLFKTVIQKLLHGTGEIAEWLKALAGLIEDDSQHLHGGSHLAVTPVQEAPTPSGLLMYFLLFCWSLRPGAAGAGRGGGDVLPLRYSSPPLPCFLPFLGVYSVCDCVASTFFPLNFRAIPKLPKI